MKYLILVLFPLLSYSQKYEVRAFLGNTNITESGYNQFAPQIGASLQFRTYKSLYAGASIKNEWITYVSDRSYHSSYTSFGAVVSLKAGKHIYFSGSYGYMKNYTRNDEYSDLERKDLQKTSLSIGGELSGKVSPFIEIGPCYLSNGAWAVQSKIGIRF